MNTLVYMTHVEDTGETCIHIVRGGEEIIEPISRSQILQIMETCLKRLASDEANKSWKAETSE